MNTFNTTVRRHLAAIEWATVVAGLVGAVLMVLKCREAFWCFAVANVGCIGLNVQLRRWPMVIMFVAFLGTSVWGLATW